MKKQQKTYLLLFLVLAIWGFLGFKIVRSLGPEPPAAVAANAKVNFEALKVKPKDTFSILVNYRDPFLGTLPKSQIPKSKSQKRDPKGVAAEKNVVYSGLITDTNTKKKLFFISVDGQQQMLAVKGEFNGVQLLSGNDKSVRVKCNGQIKTIAITQ